MLVHSHGPFHRPEVKVKTFLSSLVWLIIGHDKPNNCLPSQASSFLFTSSNQKPRNRAVGIEKIILKLLQHRRHNVQLKATSVSNMPRSGKCANSSIKCPWCQNSFFSAAKQLPSSDPQLSGNLHQRLESWHKRANLRETTAGYKPSVSHQATRIIWSLTCWENKQEKLIETTNFFCVPN